MSKQLFDLMAEKGRAALDDDSVYAEYLKLNPSQKKVADLMAEKGRAALDDDSVYADYLKSQSALEMRKYQSALEMRNKAKADYMREKAKADYEEDVRNLKNQETQEKYGMYFPRTVKAETFPQALGAAVLDASSLPGRAIAAGIGGLATGAGEKFIGNGEFLNPALEEAQQIMSRKGGNEYQGFIPQMAESIVKDPYMIPLAATGGILAKPVQMAGSWLGRTAIAGGLGAGIGAVIGSTERALNPDENVKAGDIKDIAKDALLSGILGGGFHALGEAGTGIINAAKEKLGRDIIASTPMKMRESVIRAFSPKSNLKDAAQEIGSYITTSPEGKYIPTTIFGKPAAESIVENIGAKQKIANEELLDLYGTLDNSFKENIKQGINPQGINPEKIMNSIIERMRADKSKAYDIDAIRQAANSILETRVRPYNQEIAPGQILPSTARDMRNRIYEEIKDNPKHPDLNDFFNKLYSKINDELNLQSKFGTTSNEALEAIERINLRGRPAEETLASKNEAAKKALSLGEGIERSRYFNPQEKALGLMDAADVAQIGLAASNPAAAVTYGLKQPGFRRGIGEILESTPTSRLLAAGLPALVSSKRNQPSDNRQAELQQLQSLRNLTEMEYRNLSNIISTPARNRTPQQIQYLAKYMK